MLLPKPSNAHCLPPPCFGKMPLEYEALHHVLFHPWFTYLLFSLLLYIFLLTSVSCFQYHLESSEHEAGKQGINNPLQSLVHICTENSKCSTCVKHSDEEFGQTSRCLVISNDWQYETTTFRHLRANS